MSTTARVVAQIHRDSDTVTCTQKQAKALRSR
jgi:hypothetical protein